MPSLLTRAWLKILQGTLGVVRFGVHWFLFILHDGYRVAVPPATDPILLRSATSLAADIRQGKVKSEDVVRAFIERIREVEPYINATTENRFKDALREAQLVDDRVSLKSPDHELLLEKPLLGVPFSVKALIKVEGMSSEWASLLYKGSRATEDADVVRLMKDAGAICFVMTNIPEMGMALDSTNKLYGRSSNPYDTRRTCGGSSGGEGALLGAAGSVIGLGNDAGGSIRLPAFFNGIFGHKPSRGAVSNVGTFPANNDSTTDDFIIAGPMCRYAEDLTTLMKVLNRGAKVPLTFRDSVDFRKIKIYYKLSMGKVPTIPKLSQDYVDAIKQAISYFEVTYGIKAIEATNLNLTKSLEMFSHVIQSKWDLMEIVLPNRPDFNKTNELLKLLIGRSKVTYAPLVVMNTVRLPFIYSPSKADHYTRLSKETDKQFEDMLDEDSVFFYPTFCRTAPFHYETHVIVGGLGYTAIFNTLGMPSTQCPLGLDRDGLPMGLQVVGSRGNDSLTLAFAVEFEKAFGGWIQPS